MSADRLREAARLMRERAEVEPVPSGPWETEFSDVIRTDVPLGNEGYMIAEAATVEEARHIASWHPAVAIAVADWLETFTDWPYDDCGDEPCDYPPCIALRRALTVADAYLGSQS